MDIILFLGTGYARQEWKATLTVAIVVLTFLICWLPFFVLALVRPLAQQIIIPGTKLNKSIKLSSRVSQNQLSFIVFIPTLEWFHFCMNYYFLKNFKGLNPPL